MNTTALTIAGAGLLIFAAASTRKGSIEAGDGDVGGVVFSVDSLTDTVEKIYNQVTEEPATVDTSTAETNIRAFLYAIQQAEGTARASDPYRVCFGYKHTVQSFSDHPAVTGEWLGETLSDGMCRNAGFGPGCRSSAAGAYQIVKRTWLNLRDRLKLPDFSPSSQDSAAVELIRRRGALSDVQAGRFAAAVHKCRQEWASLPGNYARQGQRSMEALEDWYVQAGGVVA